MWTCGNCHENLEDQFDACWNCGCSRKGKLNLDFTPESASDDPESPISQEFAKDFVCPRCKHHEARCQRITTRGAGWNILKAEDFLAVSCRNCGLTEFYSLTVLERRSDLGNFLRGLFGG